MTVCGNSLSVMKIGKIALQIGMDAGSLLALMQKQNNPQAAKHLGKRLSEPIRHISSIAILVE